MKTIRAFAAFAMLGCLLAPASVSAQPAGMNNSAGGSSSSDIPGSMGSGTAANSPTETSGGASKSDPGAARASAMGTPAPGGDSSGGTLSTGRGVTGPPTGSSDDRP
jgi:hypothetical protein